MTFPDWFMVMAKRWLECLNLNGEDCNTTPFPVVKHASPALQQDKDGRFPDCVNLNLYETGDHQVLVLLSTVTPCAFVLLRAVTSVSLAADSRSNHCAEGFMAFG